MSYASHNDEDSLFLVLFCFLLFFGSAAPRELIYHLNFQHFRTSIRKQTIQSHLHFVCYDNSLRLKLNNVLMNAGDNRMSARRISIIVSSVVKTF